ncbi:MAG: hypothetical protein ABGY95_08085 [Rubritalea sp.]|uniref:hypothetical protein n=1 Tax=Rubritalea sp. TaxID=2109375 RepID=UPI003242CC88
MTRSELDKVSAAVGGMIQLTDMLTQITHAKHCTLARALANKPKGLEGLYGFFANGPGDPPAGYYLYIDKDTDPALEAYDTLDLTYGYYAGHQAGEGYTLPFIKCADGRYALIQMKQYASLIH